MSKLDAGELKDVEESKAKKSQPAKEEDSGIKDLKEQMAAQNAKLLEGFGGVKLAVENTGKEVAGNTAAIGEIKTELGTVKVRAEEANAKADFLKSALDPFGPMLANKEAPEAMKRALAAQLYSQGKFKEARDLLNKKHPEGYIEEVVEYAKSQAVERPVNGVGAAVAGAAGAGLASVAWDFANDILDTSLPRTGGLSFLRDLFGKKSRR